MTFGNLSVDQLTSSTGQSLSPASSSATMKNRLINSGMAIAQRGTSFNAPLNGYALDRWYASIQSLSSTSTISQSSNAPAGFTNSLAVNVATGGAIGTNLNYVVQYIEGYNTADLNFGTANAKTVTISFWVYSSVTGLFGGSLRNYTSPFVSYPFTYSIPTANTWTYISITIPGDTTGTWGTGNTGSLSLFFDLGSSSTYQGTAGSWQSGNIVGVTGTQTLITTSGATWQVTGVQLEVGTVASSFDYRDYGRELALCQRYYWRNSGTGANFHVIANGGYSVSTTRVNSTLIRFPVTMRTSPSSTYSGGGFYDGSSVVASSGSYLYQAYSPDSFSFDLGSSTLNAGRSCSWGVTNSNEYIDASAEL